jgi:alkanesulfonate monooxygenase SsuD/methylene tetrahydromethanopterin reductase-like flavin-dependent oxidoreductase (luciferase family)
MRFGLFGSAQARRGEDRGAHGFADFVDYNVEAEALGFHGSFLVEHHFTAIGQVSAPLALLAWVAARTTRLRLGTAVMVLPWHNPVLLAEEAATLDLMSGGRLDFGVGKGYRHTEFHGFAMAIEEAEARFDEALDIIRTAWTSNARFSHRGRFWRFDDIVVEPAPLQRPHPPLWMAAGSADSITRAAARGANLLLDQFADVATTAARMAHYRRAVEAQGRAFDPASVAVARNLFVAYDAAERSAALERLQRQHHTMLALSRDPARAVRSHILGYDDADSGAAALYGTPDEIASGLAALAGAGVRYVLLNTGGTSRETLRRFARDVMPAFPEVT